MKSPSIPQWLSKKEITNVLTHQTNLDKGNTERKYPHLHPASTDGYQTLCIPGDGDSTDPTACMAVKDGAHRDPVRKNPRGHSWQNVYAGGCLLQWDAGQTVLSP